MACTHTAAMSVLATFAGARSCGREVPLKASAATDLTIANGSELTPQETRWGNVHRTRRHLRIVRLTKVDHNVLQSKIAHPPGSGDPKGSRNGNYRHGRCT